MKLRQMETGWVVDFTQSDIEKLTPRYKWADSKKVDGNSIDAVDASDLFANHNDNKPIIFSMPTEYEEILMEKSHEPGHE